MAERSFAKEVEDLRIGGGETFHGEGILAVTKALLQSGVSYVGGYQGAPISHLMDVLSDAQDILGELKVHFLIFRETLNLGLMPETRASERFSYPTISQ